MITMLPFLYLAAVLTAEVLSAQKRKREIRELMEFADFLSEMKEEFSLCKSVTEAIFRTSEAASAALRPYLEKIVYFLEDEETDVSEFTYPGHLKQMKLFLIQCRNAVWYGSGKHAEESVFVRNMTELRRDVLNECTKRSQTEYLFAGLGLVSAAPAAFFPVVRSWGMKNMPELADFYRGMAGKIVVLLLFLCTIGSYFLMRLLRRSNGALYHRPEFLERFLNLSFFENLEKRAAGGAFERFGRKQLKRAGMEKNGMEYWFLAGVAGIVLGFVYVLVLWDISFPVLFFGAFVSFVLGVLGTMAIYRYLSYLRGLGITGEVLGLQSIILLLFEAPNMTIGKLLETMGEYAEIFRRDLLFCADRYAAEESEALAMLTEESLPQEFRRMTKKLQISERLGLVPAFAELSADRQYFREQQRIDTEQQLHKRVANAQVLAFLPMFFLLFAYLIFPFLAASLGQMSEIFGEMNQMRAF